jgi:hypothetical protein
MRHNKKRNTAFLFEALIAEMTKAVVQGDLKKQARTRRIISKHFKKGTALHEELQLYKAILETRGLERIVAEKLIFEVKAQRKFILDGDVFEEQTELVRDMGEEYSKSVFANFVPNYKDLATLAQLFNPSVPVKDRVLLESKVVNYLSSEPKPVEENMKPIDNLTYKTFVSKFNEKYSETLTEQQKKLLSRYISSFSDNGLELKIYLNEEIGRLKEEMQKNLDSQELSEDKTMKENAKRVLSELNSYSKKEIDSGMIQSLLKIQDLVLEMNS